MQTIRRLYVYLVAFISMEVVTWGLIGLARSIIGSEVIGSDANQLASAISLIAVGVPVFLLHWWLAQRSIGDENERFTWLRSIFLYGALLATLIPVAQNILAILNRFWIRVFNLPVRLAFIGAGQSWADNIIAVLMNGLIAAYFVSILRQDWGVMSEGKFTQNEAYYSTRRLYRYIWVLYGLAMVVGGFQQVLRSVLNSTGWIGQGLGASLGNGLALLILGTPLWIYAWRNVQSSLVNEGERRSTLRLMVLYILSLIGISGVLIPAGMVLYVILLAILGDWTSLSALITRVSDPLSAAIPFTGVWLYYERILKGEVEDLPDQTKRAGLRRLYSYILSFVGLTATIIGLTALLSFIIDTLLKTIHDVAGLRERLSMALSTLTIGIPLWLISWRQMIVEAAQDGEPGDHSRRSLIRKVYLYLILFASVIGVMGSAGSLIYQVLSKILGEPQDNFQRASWDLLGTLLLYSLVLIYHWATLRADGRRAEKNLRARHEAFPILVLVNEISDFSEEMLNVLLRELPSLPVIVHVIDNGVPDENLSEAKAVILPGDLAAHPSEAIRLWLQGFTGTRLVVPTPSKGWLWTYGSGRSLSSLARQTAKNIRHLSEGEEIPKIRDTSAWMVMLYILAGIMGIPIIIGLLSALLGW